jgi:hypothetical protein
MASQTYDYTRHGLLPYVDKQYKELLTRVASKNDWTYKRTVEKAISAFAASLGVE